jgi:hypothetical protein
MAANDQFPMWKFYPSRTAAPPWVEGVIEAFAAAKAKIDSRSHRGLSSDEALAAVRPALVRLGFSIEASKSRADKLSRPVLFGEVGRTLVAYEVDGFHPNHGAVLEVEAGRGAANNADYRDLIRTSLMVDAQYLILAMMLEYTGGGTTIRSYAQTRERLDAIYASERLKLPLAGVVLVGY